MADASTYLAQYVKGLQQFEKQKSFSVPTITIGEQGKASDIADLTPPSLDDVGEWTKQMQLKVPIQTASLQGGGDIFNQGFQQMTSSLQPSKLEFDYGR